MTIRAWKRGSAGTSISINCLGASGLSYLKGAFLGHIFALFYIYTNFVEKTFLLSYIIILRNFSVKTKNC